MKQILMLLLCCLLAVSQALGEETPACDGWEYLLLEDGTAMITGRTDEKCMGTVEVPAQLAGIPVTVIGDYALAYRQMSGVILPEGVTTIGVCAFNACYSLETVVLPESLQVIGADAFLCCSALREINIPAGLLEIGDEAFMNCFSLIPPVLPAHTTIGTMAFEMCDE